MEKGAVLMIETFNFGIPEETMSEYLRRETTIFSDSNCLHNLHYAQAELKNNRTKYAALTLDPFYFKKDNYQKELAAFLEEVKSVYNLPVVMFLRDQEDIPSGINPVEHYNAKVSKREVGMISTLAETIDVLISY